MRAAAVALVLLATPVWAQDDAGWALLNAASLSEVTEGGAVRVEKVFPPELVQAAEAFEISGYLVPNAAQPYLKRFLLVPDPANCPFCGDSGYGPVLEVEMTKALPDLPEGTPLTLKGRLELDRSPETYDLFRLTGAEVVESP